MTSEINLPIIMLAAFLSSISPGPATLAIAGTSMSSGRQFGLALAAGIITGSWIWSVSAAIGLGAIMLANAWLLDIIRYLGATYLLFLAYKSAISVFSKKQSALKLTDVKSTKNAYIKGLMLHLTNPKAVLFFGSLFSLGVPKNAALESLVIVICAVGLQSFVIFFSYAILFSNPRITASYQKMQRGFEAVFAVFFSIAGIKILTSHLD